MKKRKWILGLLALSLILSVGGCMGTSSGNPKETTKEEQTVKKPEETTEEAWTPHYVKPEYGDFCLVYNGEILDPHMSGMDLFEADGWKKKSSDTNEYKRGREGTITNKGGTTYIFECRSGFGTPIEGLYINGVVPIDCTLEEFCEAIGAPIDHGYSHAPEGTDEYHYTSPKYLYPDGVYSFSAEFETKTYKMVSIKTYFTPKSHYELYGVMDFPEE